jgi:hypothetical protein
MNEFSSSKSVLKETNVKLTVLWLASMPLVLGAIFIAFAPTTGMALTTLTGYFLLSGGVHAVQTALFTRRWRKRRLDLDDEKITYRSARRVRCAHWRDISRVKVRENARGDVYSITLSVKKIRWFWIYGFNEMEKILSLVEDRVSDGVDIRTGPVIFYLENPTNFVVFAWVVMGITLFFFAVAYIYGRQFFGLI